MPSSNVWFMIGAVLAALMSAATIPAHAADLAAARKAIEAQYARFDAAVARKDPAPFDGLVTPDFRLVDQTGVEFDLGQWTTLWQHNARLFATMTQSSAVQSVTMEGDAVLAVVRRESTLKLRGSSDKLGYEDIVHDTWVKVGAEWRLRRSVAVHSKPLAERAKD
jgi:hypothetical protein